MTEPFHVIGIDLGKTTFHLCRAGRLCTQSPVNSGSVDFVPDSPDRRISVDYEENFPAVIDHDEMVDERWGAGRNRDRS